MLLHPARQAPQRLGSATVVNANAQTLARRLHRRHTKVYTTLLDTPRRHLKSWKDSSSSVPGYARYTRCLLTPPNPVCDLAWLTSKTQHVAYAVERPLVVKGTKVVLHLLGIYHTVPVNAHLIAEVVKQVKPDVIAIEYAEVKLKRLMKRAKQGKKVLNKLVNLTPSSLSQSSCCLKIRDKLSIMRWPGYDYGMDPNNLAWRLWLFSHIPAVEYAASAHLATALQLQLRAIDVHPSFVKTARFLKAQHAVETGLLEAQIEQAADSVGPDVRKGLCEWAQHIKDAGLLEKFEDEKLAAYFVEYIDKCFAVDCMPPESTEVAVQSLVPSGRVSAADFHQYIGARDVFMCKQLQQLARELQLNTQTHSGVVLVVVGAAHIPGMRNFEGFVPLIA